MLIWLKPGIKRPSHYTDLFVKRGFPTERVVFEAGVRRFNNCLQEIARGENDAEVLRKLSKLREEFQPQKAAA